MASVTNDALDKFTVSGSVNNYNREKSQATAEEFKQASLIGGHSWNLLTHDKKREVYLRHARNDAHYVTETGQATSDWWTRKQRVYRPDREGRHASDSSVTVQCLTCPPTAGKEAQRNATRQLRQLCQTEAPMDFAQYSARKGELTPRTPARDPQVLVPSQERRMTPPPRFTPRVSAREHWTPRRGELREERRPPADRSLYQTADQLRTDSFENASSSAFSKKCDEGAMDQSIRTKTHFSRHRMDLAASRDITSWPMHSCKITREDPFHVKPLQRSGNSCVKYDIITNERKEFWY